MNGKRCVELVNMVRLLFLVGVVASCCVAPVHAQNGGPGRAPEGNQRTFGSADEALAALASAAAAADREALKGIFASSYEEISSGDAVADKASYERFSKRLKKRANLVKKGDSKVILYVGAENWPFPFPIVRAGDRWYFDGEAGRLELFDRRIGANELRAIKVCRELARSQREYAERDRDGDEVLEYAQRFHSSPGKKDGLYWPGTGADESPLGPAVAAASDEGYALSPKSQPFHGYRYRMIARQGPKPPGGAYGYVINGNMIGGFAIVAYPAKWGSSGLKTFIVNQQGKVYEKDLGARTEALVAGMRAYNPDSTWSPVESK